MKSIFLVIVLSGSVSAADLTPYSASPVSIASDLALKVAKAGDTMTGDLSLGSNRLSAGPVTASSVTVTGNLGVGGTITGVGAISGLTANTIPKASAANALTGSIMTDNGVGIGVLTSTQVYPLVVNGVLTGGAVGLSMQKSNLTIPFTTYNTANSYGTLGMSNTDVGGMVIRGHSVSGAITGLSLRGGIGVTDPTDTTPAVSIFGYKHDGATGLAGLGALETVMAIYNTGNATPLLSVLGSGSVTIPGSSFSVGTSTLVVAGGYTSFAIETKAAINLMRPRVGGIVTCSDCTNTYTLCVGTGTAAGAFREVGTATNCN